MSISFLEPTRETQIPHPAPTSGYSLLAPICALLFGRCSLSPRDCGLLKSAAQRAVAAAAAPRTASERAVGTRASNFLCIGRHTRPEANGVAHWLGLVCLYLLLAPLYIPESVTLLTSSGGHCYGYAESVSGYCCAPVRQSVGRFAGWFVRCSCAKQCQRLTAKQKLGAELNFLEYQFVAATP